MPLTPPPTPDQVEPFQTTARLVMDCAPELTKPPPAYTAPFLTAIARAAGVKVPAAQSITHRMPGVAIPIPDIGGGHSAGIGVDAAHIKIVAVHRQGIGKPENPMSLQVVPSLLASPFAATPLTLVKLPAA